jgi:hypothetical protein
MKLSTLVSILPFAFLTAAFPQVTDPLPPTSTTRTATPIATDPIPPNRCGGFIANSPICPTGETCLHPMSVNPDVPGYCIGQQCGGFTNHPQTCPQGQVCVHDKHPDIVDIPGECLMENVKCTAGGEKACPGAPGKFRCVADPRASCTFGDKGCNGLCAPNSSQEK